jgi:hypothetical protein
MMKNYKITKIEPVIAEYIEMTIDGEEKEFRRICKDWWEERYGESWETESSEERELEEAYQNFKK